MASSRRWSFQYTSQQEASSNSAKVFERQADSVLQHFELSTHPSPPLGQLSLQAQATLQEPFAQPNWQYLKFVQNNNNNNIATMATDNEEQAQVSPLSSDSVSSVPTGDCVTQAPVPRQRRQPTKKPRYYAHALTNEDKKALAEGQENHNLKKWTPQDLVRYHEDQKQLVPRGVDKVGRMNALADIEKSKKESQLKVSQAAGKVGYFRKWARKSKTANMVQVPESTHPAQHLSQSKYELRLPDTVAQDPPAIALHPPTGPSNAPLQRNRAHVRAASSSPNMSGTSPRRSQPPSGHTSGSSSRVRSPLANEICPFVHNPNLTFDSFLAPHKDGKGETHYELDNAKQPTALKKRTNSADNVGATILRRMSRMPSLPNLRKRFSRIGSMESE